MRTLVRSNRDRRTVAPLRRTLSALLLAALSARGLAAQQYVLSPAPTLVISGETDPSAQFNTLLGVTRLASGTIALGTFDPIGITLYDARGALLRRLAVPGEGPGEMRMPQYLGRRADSLVTFDIGLRRVSFYTSAGFQRQARARLPAARGTMGTVVGVLPSGALLVVQVPYLRPPSPDGATRDREALLIVPADTAAAPLRIGGFAGYGLVYYTPPGESEPHFLMDYLNGGTSWAVVGNEVAVADPDRAEVLLFNGSTGKPSRTVRLPISPRPFDAKAVQETRERLAPVLLGAKRARSAARAAADTAHCELMFDLAKRPKVAPYFRRLVRATDGGIWVERYREHNGLPSEYLRIDASGKVSGTLKGPANVQFHEFGADYALGVRDDPETDLQSIVLYTLRRK